LKGFENWELKKFEVAQENRDFELTHEASRLEQIEMDELGLQAHRMKHR